jgi:hypothetical protein
MFGKCFQILPHSCYIEFQKKMHWKIQYF